MHDILATAAAFAQEPQVQAYGGPAAVVGIVLVREVFGWLRERGKQKNYAELVKINGKVCEVLGTLSERQEETRREARDAAECGAYCKQSLSAMHKRLDRVSEIQGNGGAGSAAANV